VNPPWGVTANIMVKGSRCNHTVQFKGIYPKTGGGEDIDFVFQMKELYGGDQIVVGVLGARAAHPWWRGGNVCFKQIMGWANGDSICLTEWPQKTFLVFPNWIECIMLSMFTLPFLSCRISAKMQFLLVIASLDHLWKFWLFYPTAYKVCSGSNKLLRSLVVALGASTVISSQEITRVYVIFKRTSFYSFSRRMDWFDGQARIEVLDYQIRSGIQFLLYCLVFLYFAFQSSNPVQPGRFTVEEL
jgi:hypothetical protein